MLSKLHFQKCTNLRRNCQMALAGPIGPQAADGLRAGSPTSPNQPEARNSVGIVLVSRTATGKLFALFILPAISLVIAAEHPSDASNIGPGFGCRRKSASHYCRIELS